MDRSTMTLRIGCKEEECSSVSQLIGHAASTVKRSWGFAAPESIGADLDGQVQWILSRLTSDLSVWRQLTSKYEVDLFCGLFLEHSNRGVSLSVDTMGQLAERGIEIGFDIYAPE